MYHAYLEHVADLVEQSGFHLYSDILRIPSTKRVCFVSPTTAAFFMCAEPATLLWLKGSANPRLPRWAIAAATLSTRPKRLVWEGVRVLPQRMQRQHPAPSVLRTAALGG